MDIYTRTHTFKRIEKEKEMYKPGRSDEVPPFYCYRIIDQANENGYIMLLI